MNNQLTICHLAPFAPYRCGLYEAARDMCKADIISGNRVMFVDTGITNVDGTREEPQIGAIDDRLGFKLETASTDMINDADILVMHTGVIDNWIVKTQAPIIWVVHGRPLACFRPESQGKGNSYSVYHEVASWKRTKKMVYFWKEFKPYWLPVIEESKHEIFNYPVIDQQRFNIDGIVHTIPDQDKGKYNVLICDSAREDVDLFELIVGCIETAKVIEGIKFHFYGIDNFEKPYYQYLFDQLRKLNALGTLHHRVSNVELLYRVMDCLISPNRIIVRTIAEALSCGCPVISENKEVSTWCVDMSDIDSIINAFKNMTKTINDDKNRDVLRSKIANEAKIFSGENYSKQMNKVYKEVLK